MELKFPTLGWHVGSSDNQPLLKLSGTQARVTTLASTQVHLKGASNEQPKMLLSHPLTQFQGFIELCVRYWGQRPNLYLPLYHGVILTYSCGNNKGKEELLEFQDPHWKWSLSKRGPHGFI